MAGQPVGSGRSIQVAVWLGLVLAGYPGSPGLLWAQVQEGSYATGGQPSIYTCVDPRGRRITADRPIPECMGTGQRELRASGDLKRMIPPVLTASERAQQAAHQEQEANLQAQIKEDQRQNRALVLRYPDPAAHYRARAEVLEQQDGLIAAVRVREAELYRQRQRLATRLEFYRQEPNQAPAELRQLEQENTRQRAFQSAQLEAQQRERQRIEQRFDEELARLRKLWMQEAR